MVNILGNMPLKYYLPIALVCSPVTVTTSFIWLPYCLYSTDENVFENIVCGLIWPVIPALYCLNI